MDVLLFFILTCYGSHILTYFELFQLILASSQRLRDSAHRGSYVSARAAMISVPLPRGMNIVAHRYQRQIREKNTLTRLKYWAWEHGPKRHKHIKETMGIDRLRFDKNKL